MWESCTGQDSQSPEAKMGPVICLLPGEEKRYQNPETKRAVGEMQPAHSPPFARREPKETHALTLLSSLCSVSCQHSPLAETSGSRTGGGEEDFHTNHTGQIILGHRAGWRWRSGSTGQTEYT